LFHEVVSISNLLEAWKKFSQGKRNGTEVAHFEMHLEHHLFTLHNKLITKTYTHDPYIEFVVCDPKRRNIHKASVRDRVLHQAIFQKLYPLFDNYFIYDSYSSRENKGTHLGVERLINFCRKETKNYTRTAYVLKCDIKKFFDSIDHTILKRLIYDKVLDEDLRNLIEIIMNSFEKTPGVGLPLGNVTSQLFANIYMNEFDQFVKHSLKVKYYGRYCDDFFIVSHDKEWLNSLIRKMELFFRETLKLQLHPNKISLRKVSQGIDFLGYVIRPHVITIRNSTRRRILRKVTQAHKNFSNNELEKENYCAIIHAYLGIVSHARDKKLEYWLSRKLEILDKI
jgi:retron-type reverse transcriptase